MNIIKNLSIRVIISLAVAQMVATKFSIYYELILLSVLIGLFLLLTYLSKKF